MIFLHVFLVLLGLVAFVVGIRMLIIRFAQGHTEWAEVDAKTARISGPVGLALAVVGLGAIGANVYLVGQSDTRALNTLLGEQATQADKPEVERNKTKTQKERADGLEREGLKKDRRIAEVEADIVTGTKLRMSAEKQRDSELERAEQAEGNATDLKSRLQTMTGDLQTKTAELKAEAGRRDRAERALKSALLLQQKARFSDAELERYRGLLNRTLSFNDQLKRIQLTETYWPVLTGRGPAIRFFIERQDFGVSDAGIYGRGLFRFQSEEYLIRDKYGNPLTDDFRQVLAKNLGVAVEQAIINRVPFLDALRSIEPDFEKFLTEEPVTEAMAEAVMIQVAVKLIATRALVLVWGYADGSTGAWVRDLEPGNAETRAHPIDRDDGGEMVFLGNLTMIPIGDRPGSPPIYGNNELPNLRGLAAASAIGNLVSNCTFSDQGLQETNRGSVDVRVLEGEVYDAPNPAERKALGFLYIELKQNHPAKMRSHIRVYTVKPTFDGWTETTKRVCAEQKS